MNDLLYHLNQYQFAIQINQIKLLIFLCTISQWISYNKLLILLNTTHGWWPGGGDCMSNKTNLTTIQSPPMHQQPCTAQLARQPRPQSDPTQLYTVQLHDSHPYGKCSSRKFYLPRQKNAGNNGNWRIRSSNLLCAPLPIQYLSFTFHFWCMLMLLTFCLLNSPT